MRATFLRLAGLKAQLARVIPGLFICCLIAVSAKVLSDYSGAPVMLLALVSGMVFNFLDRPDAAVQPGIAFASRSVLRLGIILLGAGISLDLVRGLGSAVILLVFAAVVLTILFGILAGRVLRKGRDFSVLTAGATAICGASAALAIASVLPRSEESDRQVTFTVLAVTLLSTLAMIAYPVLAGLLGLDDRAAGIFIGASIHDVAQVVGAGFTISEQAGQTATMVKLTRVLMLAPVVFILALVCRPSDRNRQEGGLSRPVMVPPFVLGFLGLAALNSSGALPATVSHLLGEASHFALIAAIAAVGLRTSVRSVLSFGGAAMALVLAETVFIAGLVLLGLMLLG